MQPKLNSNQVRGFWASWGGWTLDGMDSFIFALVMTPALRELLPKSGIPGTPENVGYYGGLLFALFLIGWGLSFLWGPVSDKFGRVRTLMLTILCFSVFTFLCALSRSVWQLAIFRLLAGAGIGGEWAMGGTFVSEEWPEERRKTGAALMHTGYYAGFFLAAVANHYIGVKYGWRGMFAIGGAPAILVGFIRYGVTESTRWIKKADEVRAWSLSRPLARIFSPTFRRRTIFNSLYVLVSIIGLWAGSVYVPTGMAELASRRGFSAIFTTQLTSYATMVLSIGTILGCVILPPIAERYGRRKGMAAFFFLMMISIAGGFGWTFYAKENAILWFLVWLFFLGLGGANFAMYTIWLPEQYPTECRGTAFAFTTSVGRFIGAGFTFLVGAGVSHFHTVGIPVSLTSIAFIAGIALLPFGLETKGQPLPN